MNQASTLTARTSLLHGSAALQAAWIAGFALLTALGAQIEIPHQPVPYTLQTFFVLMAGGLLGWRNGLISMGLYVAMGAVGLPVFSGAGFGLARILGPTGGYLLAFPVAAALIGVLVPLRREIWWTGVSMAAGLLVIFTLGTVQLYATYVHSWPQAFTSGFLLFSWWDGVKLVSATMLVYGLRQRTLEVQ